jgi:YidC/Oxa1 family membrane protein insertase
MWLIDQITPGNPAYSLPVGYHIKGNLNAQVLQESFNSIVQRHEILRTTFARQEGEPAQIVHPECKIIFATTELDHLPEADREVRLRELVSAEVSRSFDLSRLPLVRVSLFRLGNAEHVLIINIHHIVVDGLSIGLIVNELDTFYRALGSSEYHRPTTLAVQYADFAQWQRKSIATNGYADQVEFWQKQFPGTPPVLELPCDLPRPPLQSFKGSNVFFKIPGTLTLALMSLGSAESCTFFMTIFAAFQVLLWRYSGAVDMTSMKSMRAMQKLQPEIERIREKYKNDAAAVNTAIMALYKENKVNPAGGCIPMVLQMPLFFALYAVLFNAIELRQAPFVGWIHDLSAPDQLGMVMGFPIRVLPLLMAASGLLQQRLTPTDPSQATTMYMMNVVMVVFFYNLPSGLVLYWTVMNLLTALQQWLVLRQDQGGPAPAQVVAPARPGKRRG